MIKKRVIIVFQLNGGVLFRSKQFRLDYQYTKSQLGTLHADEVAIINVTRSLPDREAFHESATHYVRNYFGPVTIGGWIRSEMDASEAIRGDLEADRVLINTLCFEKPEVVTRLAKRFGSQAISAGIDFDKAHAVFSDHGTKFQPVGLVEWAKHCTGDLGAGEIFLTSIERDGSLSGYDLAALGKVAAAVSVPVTIAGGCGGWHHMAEAFNAGADAAATSNIFHLTDTSLANAKAYLHEHGYAVRLK